MGTITMRGGGETVRAGKLVCVGRNYSEHIAEMRAAEDSGPIFFLKPSTALLGAGGTIRLPGFSREVHHEVEMVALVGRRLRRADAAEALAAVAGYGVGIDLTARDRQAEAKRRGEPWAVAKGFDHSAPVSDFAPTAEVSSPHDLSLELRINGELRQAARTSQMLLPLAELLAGASAFFTLEPGDLLFTGTPSGVGPVRPGDVLDARLEGVAEARWRVEG